MKCVRACMRVHACERACMRVTIIKLPMEFFAFSKSDSELSDKGVATQMKALDENSVSTITENYRTNYRVHLLAFLELIFLNL